MSCVGSCPSMCLSVYVFVRNFVCSRKSFRVHFRVHLHVRVIAGLEGTFASVLAHILLCTFVRVRLRLYVFQCSVFFLDFDACCFPLLVSLWATSIMGGKQSSFRNHDFNWQASPLDTTFQLQTEYRMQASPMSPKPLGPRQHYLASPMSPRSVMSGHTPFLDDVDKVSFISCAFLWSILATS